MIYISHRGNVFGPDPSKENHPLYIQLAIDLGYDCEIDLYYQDSSFFLGHDNPQYKVDLNWLQDRKHNLWIHCKDLDALCMFNYMKDINLNYFWHQGDTVTLTSKGYIWAHYGKQPIRNSIAVMPEIHNEDVKRCIGICSDYIEKYKQ